MAALVGVVRSLTNPFSPDPVIRPDTTCNVAKKRSVVNKHMFPTRSLSAPTLPGASARSAASIKRAAVSKAGILKDKKVLKKHPTQPSDGYKSFTDLEYFNYYHHVPPTPLVSKKGELLFEVDRVLGKMVCDCGRTKYLVKWAGYPHSENSCITELPEEFQPEWV
jgi:hypothetical protein